MLQSRGSQSDTPERLNKSNDKAHNKCNALGSSQNHPARPQSVETWSSTKPVPGAKKVGACCSRKHPPGAAPQAAVRTRGGEWFGSGRCECMLWSSQGLGCKAEQ